MNTIKKSSINHENTHKKIVDKQNKNTNITLSFINKRQLIYAGIAQSVERGTENPCVGGSIPSPGIISILEHAHLAQLVEQLIRNE